MAESDDNELGHNEDKPLNDKSTDEEKRVIEADSGGDEAIRKADGNGEHIEGEIASGRDDEYANDEEKWENIRALGCIPRVIEGNFSCCGCSGMRYYINPTVMTLSVIIIWSFVIWCAVDPESAGLHLGKAKDFTVIYFGWFYIFCVFIFGAFCIFLCFSKYGDIILGPPDEPPKYSYPTWFAMLFSAGIGIGLYFFSVAESVIHLTEARSGGNKWYHETTNEQAMAAMNLSWFHLGFTASSCYVVAALPLAYHHHVHNEPLRESVCFNILIGHKYTNGIIGHLIDLTSVVSTMFGVATSLGLGVIQINAGLEFSFGIEQSVSTQMYIIWTITILATISVLTGLDRGIRRLSEINFNFSMIIFFFIFFASDTIYFVNLFIQGIGYHFQHQIELLFDTQAFEQASFVDSEDPRIDDEAIESQRVWMTSWTPFMWAWWIAWAPFVGIFIAQISRGRTVREFVIGNMIIPTLFTCIWVAVFGGIGLYNELGSIENDVECTDDDITSLHNGYAITKLSCYETEQMLWAVLDTLPLQTMTKILAIIGIVIYFVTSSDSASHVIDILTASGIEDPPKLQRIFWALSEGAVAAVLLATDEAALTALQTGSLVAALPFAVVLLFETYATWKTFQMHEGEYTPDLYNYWIYDLFEIPQEIGFVQTIFGLICPPYYQTKSRLKLIQYKNNNNKFWIWIWIISYWLTWFLILLFLLLSIWINGMIPLALTAYCFCLAICVANRNDIRTYYNINSSNTCYGCMAWIFCCCCAVIQENVQLQSQNKHNENVELEMKDLKTKTNALHSYSAAKASTYQ